MNEHRDDEKDEDLAGWLRLWDAPAVPDRLADRLLADYRSRSRPWWKRLLRAEVRLPAPIAALVAAAILGVGLLAGARLGGDRAPRLQRPVAPIDRGLADLRPLPEIRVTVLREGGPRDDQR
jgi:hypothetical protein